jgi:hypothetical protein
MCGAKSNSNGKSRAEPSRDIYTGEKAEMKESAEVLLGG